MSTTPITYAQIKEAMAAQGFPVSAGSAWQGSDQALYAQFASGACYGGGVPYKKRQAFYGIAYSGELPQAIANAVVDADYSVTIAGTPLFGEGPLSVTLTATEVGGTATNYAWTFGDGTAVVNTTVNHVTHVYANAGSVTPKMAPTFNGEVMPQVSAAVITIYTGTLAGTPLSGAHPLSTTFTLTEQGVPAGATKSYAWTFGDGGTLTTAVPTAVHSYAAAGSFTASVIPTINGVALASISAGAPVVVS